MGSLGGLRLLRVGLLGVIIHATPEAAQELAELAESSLGVGLLDGFALFSAKDNVGGRSTLGTLLLLLLGGLKS